MVTRTRTLVGLQKYNNTCFEGNAAVFTQYERVLYRIAWLNSSEIVLHPPGTVV